MNKEKLKNLLEKLTLFLTFLIVVVTWIGRIKKTNIGYVPSSIRNMQIILVLFTMAEILLLTYLDKKKNALYLSIFYMIMAVVYIAFKGAGRI